MKWTITYATNFLRVFRLPSIFPGDYCFEGGHATNFILVDWFTAFNEMDFWGEKTKEFDEGNVKYLKHIETLSDFIKAKKYFNSDYTYMVLTDYGHVFLVNPEKRTNDLQKQYNAAKNRAATQVKELLSNNMESMDAKKT